MDKIKLKYFISAARNLNFTKAAEECHVVQGTISKQISAIESELGLKLFIRKGQTLSLTRAGKKLFDDSNEYLEQYQIIDNNLKKLHLAFDDKLGIAAGTMEHGLIIPSLKDFQVNHPNIEVNFSTYTYARMSSHFRNETVDIGFCCDTCAKSIWDAKKIPVHSGEWMVCAAEDSPFWDLSEEDRASFNNQTIISIHGNEYDPVYRHFLENNYKIKSFSFTNALISIITLIQSGNGVAILPSYLEGRILGVKMEKMLLNPLSVGFSLIYNPENSKISTINRFLEYYKKPIVEIETKQKPIKKVKVIV